MKFTYRSKLILLKPKSIFSTFDKDNDGSDSNCPEERNGGWWFNQASPTVRQTIIINYITNQ
jgi:hypothetical protein